MGLCLEATFISASPPVVRTPSGEAGRPEEAGLPHGQGSGQTFCWGYGQCFAVFHEDCSSFTPARFSAWEPGGVPKLRFKKSGVPPRQQFPGICCSNTSSHSASRDASKWPVRSSYWFMDPAAFASGNRLLAATFWVHLYLQISGWWFAQQPQLPDESQKDH